MRSIREGLVAALVGATLVGLTGPGCAARVDLREPAYYQARRYPVRVVRPGVSAYYINNGWYVHDGRRWRRSDVAVRGRVIIR